MSRINYARFSLAVPVMLMSQAAIADVTTAQVWGDWKQYMESYGYQMTATEVSNGDDLTISDLSMTMDLPENNGALTMSMGPMTFAQNGGEVNIVMSPSTPMIFNFVPKAGIKNPTIMSFDVTQSGHTMTVSGTPEEMTYQYAADTFGMVLNELQADGQSYGPDNATVSITGTGAKTTTVMRVGEMRNYEQTGTIDAVNYDIKVDNPEEPVKLMLVGGTTGISFDANTKIPAGLANATDMAAMLKSGFGGKGTFSYGAGTSQMNVNDPSSGDFAATTSSDGGNIGFEMDAAALAYSGEQNNLKMSVKVAELPFPVDLSMAKGAFNLGMPISANDDPQNFAFGITLADFVMSDLIWSIFDPTSQLPRDPATVQLDLSGKAKLLVDIMDPLATASAETPGELQALTVDKILVNAVGAKLEGSGDFTFDNTDLTTFDGIPKPIGAVNVALAGGNGLMDKLVAMGILPEQQAMGARMMMGLFAVPGDAPDTLKSTVEFTEDGQVLANGQRIK